MWDGWPYHDSIFLQWHLRCNDLVICCCHWRDAFFCPVYWTCILLFSTPVDVVNHIHDSLWLAICTWFLQWAPPHQTYGIVAKRKFVKIGILRLDAYSWRSSPWFENTDFHWSWRSWMFIPTIWHFSLVTWSILTIVAWNLFIWNMIQNPFENIIFLMTSQCWYHDKLYFPLQQRTPRSHHIPLCPLYIYTYVLISHYIPLSITLYPRLYALILLAYKHTFTGYFVGYPLLI